MVIVRETNKRYCDWIAELMINEWGVEYLIMMRKKRFPNTLPGLVALQGTQKCGLQSIHYQ